MTQYDLYGTRQMSTDELQRVVADAVQLSFEARYSDFVGPYFKAEHREEVFHIEPNFLDDHDEDEILEPEFANFPVLLRVSRTQRGDEIRELLVPIPGLVHLKRVILD